MLFILFSKVDIFFLISFVSFSKLFTFVFISLIFLSVSLFLFSSVFIFVLVSLLSLSKLLNLFNISDKVFCDSFSFSGDIVVSEGLLFDKLFILLSKSAKSFL